MEIRKFQLRIIITSGLAKIAPIWRQILAVILPFVLLPLCIIFEEQIYAARCGYVMLLMGIYWVFELVPLPITGLLPAILFPLLGIQKADEVSKSYFQDSVMLFVGGLLVAIAVEQTNLHRRIALGMLNIVGAKPYWIMAGFMLISAILSMFISNTATTAMILPISIAVIMEINKQRMHASASRVTLQSIRSTSAINMNLNGNAKEELYALKDFASAANIADIAEEADIKAEELISFNFDKIPKRQQEIAKALVLCVAYASSIGGMATLTGTLTNVVFKGQFEEIYATSTDITYTSFFLFAFPTMLACLVFAWCSLTFQFFVLPYWTTGISDTDADMEINIKKMMRKKYQELGSMRFAEGSALFVFICLILLWFFRSPEFIPGWDSAFREDYISDATPALLMAFLLFLWPNRLPCRRSDSEDFEEKLEPILLWKVVSKKFPWDVVLLLGGALALADGVTESKLTDLIKEQLELLKDLSPALMAFIIAAIVTFCTGFASNAAMASIFLPVAAKLAETSNVNPLYYMLVVTLSCSFAFMFPVATPPNAIAFGCGFLRVIDMVKAGALLNLGCMGIMLGCIHTIGFAVFNLGEFPSWANVSSATSTSTGP